MRLRVAVREAQERNALEASSSPSQAPTPGASANSSDLHSSSHSHFRSSSPIDIDYSISYTAFTSRCYVPKTPFSLGCVSRLTSRGGAKMVCHHTAMVGKNAPGRARAPEAASFHNRLTGAAAIPKPLFAVWVPWPPRELLELFTPIVTKGPRQSKVKGQRSARITGQVPCCCYFPHEVYKPPTLLATVPKSCGI
jgi:hypothetical protein